MNKLINFLFEKVNFDEFLNLILRIKKYFEIIYGN